MKRLDRTVSVFPYSGHSVRKLFAPHLECTMMDYRDFQPLLNTGNGISIYDGEEYSPVRILSGKCIVPDKGNVDLTLHRGFVYHCREVIQTYLPKHLTEYFRHMFYSEINWCIQHCLIQGNERRICIAIENKFLNIAFIVTNVASSNEFDFELFMFPVECDLMKNVFNAIKGN